MTRHTCHHRISTSHQKKMRLLRASQNDIDISRLASEKLSAAPRTSVVAETPSLLPILCTTFSIHAFICSTHPHLTMTSAHLRSLYRSILRELPPPPRSSSPSALRSSIRSHFAAPSVKSSEQYILARRQETEQVVQYLKAQRIYNVLLERYNPGMTMEDEERTRLTARRVGMEMPVEFKELAESLEKNKK